MITVTLPCQCIEPGCGSYLQRALDPTVGVQPHYTVCHPTVKPPKVVGQ